MICVGTDDPGETDECVRVIAENFCEIIGMNVVGRKSFKTKSELKGNFNDIFENGLNPNVEEELKKLARALVNE